MELIFSDTDHQYEQAKNIILEKLNILAEEGEKTEFLKYLNQNINSDFCLNVDVDSEDDKPECIVFENNLSAKSLDIILKEYPKLSKSYYRDDESIVLRLFINYSNNYSAVNFYVDKSPEVLAKRESEYAEFFEKLKVAVENSVNVKAANHNGNVCLHFFTCDEFNLKKLKEVTTYLLDNDFFLNNHNFSYFLGCHNFLYTKEVPQGIIDFCDLFPHCKLSAHNLSVLFNLTSYDEEFSPIEYDKSNPPTEEYLRKNNLDINDYSQQENITLIKYFVERYNIDIVNEEIPCELDDLFKNVKFERSINYLFEKGYPLKDELKNYPVVVQKFFVEQQRKIIESNLLKEQKSEIKKKRI